MANTLKKETVAKKTPVKKSVTTAKKAPVTKVAAKSSPKKTTAKTTKAAFEGNADLYVLNGTKRLDSKHQFNKSLSPIYGVEEYYWIGSLKQGEVKLVRQSMSQVPVSNTENSGITLVGKAVTLFKVENALTTKSTECNDQVYNYCNPSSKLVYVGDAKVHTLYVRVYDNANGSLNDRWVTISIE